MDPITVTALIGGALGGVKSIFDKQKEDQDRLQNSQIARFSPWTGMKTGPVRLSPGVFSNVVGGAENALLASQTLKQLGLMNGQNNSVSPDQQNAGQQDSGSAQDAQEQQVERQEAPINGLYDRNIFMPSNDSPLASLGPWQLMMMNKRS